MCATKFVDAPLKYIDYGNKATVPEAIINALSATFHFLGYSRAYNLAPDEELGAMSIMHQCTRTQGGSLRQNCHAPLKP